MPIFLEKGRVFRVTNREPVHKGTLYITCLCKGCGQPMYLFYVIQPPAPLDDPLVGEGKVSVPCRHCKHDDIYNATDFFYQMSGVELPATYDPRVEPSARKDDGRTLKA